ncbi:hypothetical protein CTAYLR_007605 [Chrysophaeum taylorii]|uniref:LOV domain-containing protein n=1 Tax=Chrysophaeum taylorii TaxID=2483200 RepID=A0AAD7U8D8_9STRA|nr:hypothetical protein CTAYLR_007605 [Chrysophaeum taylorii]
MAGETIIKSEQAVYPPPVFAPRGDAVSQVDLDEIFDDAFMTDEWELLRETFEEETPREGERDWEGEARLSGEEEPRKRRKPMDTKLLTDAQRVERRERNREHAKRSRIRKKFLLESLLEQVTELRAETKELRQVIRDRVPDEAHDILQDCSTEESLLLCAEPSASPVGKTQQLMEPDYRLMMALQSAQQNFAVSDPSLADNPIVYASQGFLNLTGYAMAQVVGRNCRFLQGPGTDPKAVDVIRKGLADGADTSVCLLNYKADGTPFWNQFFVAALRDATGKVVNFVGVQCEVNEVPIEEIKERAKRMALLDI